MLHLPNALGALVSWRQFIVYRIEPKPDQPGKTNKFPVDHATGYMPKKGTGGAHNHDIWTDFVTASAAAQRFGSAHGVGFVFSPDDPFWFLDIDNALQADGTWSPLAQQLCGVFGNCAIEVSGSGRGLHIFGSGPVPPHGCKNEAHGLEFYHERRFVALTGTNAQGDITQAAQPGALEWLVGTYFGQAHDEHRPAEWTYGPATGWRGPVDDDDLIRRACAAQSKQAIFGQGATFRDLWEGNIEVLARVYPDVRGGQGRAYGASEADAALAAHLAFWTGRDAERMERLMYRSALAREKYEQHGSYLHLTITRAIARNSAVCVDKEVVAPMAVTPPPPDIPYAPPRPEPRTGKIFLDGPAQAELFEGCVYVTDAHKILVPGGTLLSEKQFNATYGGHAFTMNDRNEGSPSKSAFEAFTQSQILSPPRADTTAFRPGEPPAALIREPGQVLVNKYWPIAVPRKAGDISPLMRHLEIMLPIKRDRDIYLSYMAALVQYKGIKFQWAPVLQGVQGNGKSMFGACVQQAIGKKYTFKPKPATLGKNFNGWLDNNILILVEEMRVEEHRQDFIDTLKILITGGDGIEVERKGIDQITLDFCANFMFFSNHRDAVRSDENERRFAVFFTAQQTRADLAAAGIDKSTDYFPKLWRWLRAEGFAIMSEFLHTWPIPNEFNPAGDCQVAPDTSSSSEAVAASRGRVEQEIEEAVGQCRQGFCGGWISSSAIDALLERMRVNIAHNRRREILQRLGYDWHPALKDGRATSIIMPDNCRPRLFVQRGHPASFIVDPATALRAYTDAQIVVDGSVNKNYS